MRHFLSIPEPHNNRSVLLYAGRDVAEYCGNGVTWVSSPIRCMSEATESRFDVIIVRITKKSSDEIEQVVKLCAMLKKNRHSCRIPVGVYLSSADRQLIEHLKEVGVDYVKIQNAGPKSARMVEHHPPSDRLDEGIPIDQVLLRLCPHVHYSPINEGKELITCKAYSDWLVLGPQRLRTLCETPRHRTCPYYQSPRK